jgi:hypothetical protein
MAKHWSDQPTHVSPGGAAVLDSLVLLVNYGWGMWGKSVDSVVDKCCPDETGSGI